MPVINVVKLHMNTIVIVKVLSKEQVRFVDQFDVVVGQMVDIVLNNNLYQLACMYIGWLHIDLKLIIMVIPAIISLAVWKSCSSSQYGCSFLRTPHTLLYSLSQMVE